MVTKKFNRTLPEHFACESSVNTCTEGLSSLIWCCVKCPVWCGVSATGPEDLRSDRTTTLGGGTRVRLVYVWKSDERGRPSPDPERCGFVSACCARAADRKRIGFSHVTYSSVRDTTPVRLSLTTSVDRLSCPARACYTVRVCHARRVYACTCSSWSAVYWLNTAVTDAEIA